MARSRGGLRVRTLPPFGMCNNGKFIYFLFKPGVSIKYNTTGIATYTNLQHYRPVIGINKLINKHCIDFQCFIELIYSMPYTI